MRITFCTFLIASLALSNSMRAQDAPSRPLKDPGTDLSIEPTPLPKSNVSPTPEPATPKPKPSPSPKPKPTPPPSTPEPSHLETPSTPPEQTPAKKIAKVEEPVSTPTPVPVKRKSEATPSAKPEIQPPPRSRQDTRAVAAKLKALEKEWEASFNDPAVINKSLADDFVGTSPGGKIMTKKDLLREAKEDTSPPPKTTAHDLDVHFYGPDVAVVTGASKQIDKNRAGQTVEHNYRFTDTWVERDGNWQCVASQSILVPRR